jgi:hypothetical protein
LDSVLDIVPTSWYRCLKLLAAVIARGSLKKLSLTSSIHLGCLLETKAVEGLVKVG